MLRFSSVTMAAAGLLLHAAVAGAFPSLTDSVATQYPAATNLETCGTCHTSFTSAPGLNPYGAAFNTAGGLADPAAAFLAIEESDSDGDGTSNGAEIGTDAGFFPGWTCETYTTAQNPPTDLADLVDPVDPGCGGTTTTTATTSTTVTTITTSTTVTSTTTTTVPGGEPGCADPVAPYDGPVATDCLFVLQAAVGGQTCEACICDAIGSNGVNSTDALLCLKVSVGEVLPLDCPACNGGSTTTTTTGGSTTTTTGGEPTTTTTVAPTTTTSTTVAEPTTTTTDTSTTSTTTVG